MKRGDIVQLGRHRLMCGDATNPDDVGFLMGGSVADLVVTSPPYPGKRTYGDKSRTRGCWTTLMSSAMQAARIADDGQIMVNLGICHKNGEWHPYWEPWMNAMQLSGWRRFGFYIWDTNMALPGHAHGRLLPKHEFVFHFNKRTKMPNKIVRSKWGGKLRINGNKVAVNKKAQAQRQDWDGRLCASHRPLDSIILATRARIQGYPHPAKFPVLLAQKLIESYTARDQIVFDMFGGSGTTIIACEASNRRGFLMEIEPEYCEMTVARYRKHMAGGASPANFTGRHRHVNTCGLGQADDQRRTRRPSPKEKC